MIWESQSQKYTVHNILITEQHNKLEKKEGSCKSTIIKHGIFARANFCVVINRVYFCGSSNFFFNNASIIAVLIPGSLSMRSSHLKQNISTIE